MKKLISILFLCSCMVQAQDVITKTNGEDINAKVLEIGQTEIKYKKFDNQQGATYVISKSDVFSVKYENGSKDVFNAVNINAPAKTSPADNTSVSSDMYQKGQLDAQRYYTGYKAAGGGVLVTTLVFSPLIGLFAVAGCSVPPQRSNLAFPSDELMKNPQYEEGYKNAAKKKKVGKVWENWAIGTLITVAITAIFLGTL